MKKVVCLLLVAVMVLSLCACSTEKNQSMLDFTAMSSTIMSAELFTMTMEPENYVGRTIKIKGQFSALPNPVTGQEDYAILTMDAAACCVQGLDLSLAGSPESYPPVNSQVTVTGVYQKYTDQGITRYRIADAVWE